MPTENENNAGRSDTDNRGSVGRRVRPDIAERIRNRANSGSGGDSRGSGGDSRGSGGDNSNVAVGDTGTNQRGSIADPSGSENGHSGIADGLRIVTGNANRRNTGDNGNGDNGNSSSRSDSGDGDGRTASELSATVASVNPDLFPEKPSLIRITDVVADEGTRKKRGRKPGSKTNVVRINTKGVDYSDIVIPLGIALDFVFSIPVSFGWGKHWELSSEETEDLTTCVKDVLEAFPSETTAQFIRALEKYIPLLSLGITGWGIIKPRLEKTSAIAAEKKRLAVNQQREKGTVAVPDFGHRQSSVG